MAHHRPGTSTTLPRNFAPMGLDSLDEPKTPEQLFPEATLPPPPHHTTHRIRRPRIGHFSIHNNALPNILFASDIPIPSVEISGDSDPIQADSRQPMDETLPSNRLFPPERYDARPRTPLAQTSRDAPTCNDSAWSMDRPSSALSVRSDSSCSSLGSLESRPSFGDSCTSPESDMTDPFLPHYMNVAADTPSKPSRIFVSASTLPTKPRWSIEQDNHLWNTYQMYLGDPTITPFKTVPGSLPPLGVCHRVAREARRSWPKATRVSFEIVRRHTFRDVMDESFAVRDKTPQVQCETAERGPELEERRSVWPKESATRRRLKELCKRKYSIAPHYQRLMQSRSPSPFHDTLSRHSSPRASRRASVAREKSVSYATRDLGISLIASGATAPLTQLVTGDSPPMDSEDWFNTPVEPPPSSPPTAGDSQLGLGLSSEHMNIPRLASPFKPNTWGPSRARRNPCGSGQFDTIHATGPRLFSPCRFDPATTSSKRRAEQHFDSEVSPGGSDLERVKHDLIFSGSSKDINQRRIRLRNRGSTMGAVSGRERIDRFFTPPGTVQEPAAGKSDDWRTASATLLVPETEDKLKRLGSPFELDPNKRSNRIRSPRHIPSMSDPFLSTSGMSSPSGIQRSEGRPAAFDTMPDYHSPTIQQIGQDPPQPDQTHLSTLPRF
jgi:hypothetical protein